MWGSQQRLAQCWGSQQCSLSPRVASTAHPWDILQEQNQQLQQFRPQEARANS